ncbi:hypothetical protein P8452_65503 [Trifolium repens]|nr:hypothetical protein P8452_65503 [Trifolium repens]
MVVVRRGGGLPSAPPCPERRRVDLRSFSLFFSDSDFCGSGGLVLVFEVWFCGYGAPVWWLWWVWWRFAGRTVGGLRRQHTPVVLSLMEVLEAAFYPMGGVVSWVGLEGGGAALRVVMLFHHHVRVFFERRVLWRIFILFVVLLACCRDDGGVWR